MATRPDSVALSGECGAQRRPPRPRAGPSAASSVGKGEAAARSLTRVTFDRVIDIDDRAAERPEEFAPGLDDALLQLVDALLQLVQATDVSRNA